MGMPCRQYLVVMLDLWLPLLIKAGELDVVDKPCATGQALAQLGTDALIGCQAVLSHSR